MTSSTLGLDLAPMRNWLEREKTQLDRTVVRFAQHTHKPNIDLVELKQPEQLEGQFNLSAWWQELVAFPEPAQERILSVLRVVEGEVPTYFHRSSTNRAPIPTTDPDEAMGETYVAPSSYWRVPETPQLAYGVTLYRLPEHFTDRRVQYFIHLQGLIHELAHVLVGATWADTELDLLLPNGERTNGERLIREFVALLREYKLPPISHYSAGYWRTWDELEPAPGENALMPKGLDEELAETIAAWVVKFCHCEPFTIVTDGGRQRIELPGGSGRSFYPFSGRQTLDAWVERFLYGRWTRRA